MGLQQFEHRLERLVEGAFAKAFRGELQPIELGRRLTREMDLHRTVAARGLIAPNAFEVVLSETDFDRFGGFVDVLARELLEGAREHAREERYNFLGPVQVDICSSSDLDRSTFLIHSSVVESDSDQAGHIVLPDGQRVPVEKELLTIGRLDDCDIRLNDANVSRHHAELRRDGKAVYLVDLGSTNGSLVNGALVHEQRLYDGDVLRIGTSTLRYEAS